MSDRQVTRRSFLRSTGAAPLALACLGAGLAGKATAATKAKNIASRPPGTCSGWTDRAGDGLCDRSQQAKNRCNGVGCPGNAGNIARPKAKQNGAPVGTCALWSGTARNPVCTVSTRINDACIYAKCPANKLHRG